MFLCETKLFVLELRRVASRLGFDCCVGVDSDVSGGGGEKRGFGVLVESGECGGVTFLLV